MAGDTAERLKAAGADFVIFDPAGTPGSVLTDDELGKFLTLATDLDDVTARAVQALPIDGVAIASDAAMIPLSVASIMRLHKAITSGAHALVCGDFDPRALSTGDLEAMRGSGVSAIALPATDSGGLEQLGDAIRQLPEPRLTQDERIALIPQVGPASDPDDYDLRTQKRLAKGVSRLPMSELAEAPEELDSD